MGDKFAWMLKMPFICSLERMNAIHIISITASVAAAAIATDGDNGANELVIQFKTLNV